jgi:hypothetical protein
VLRLHDGFGQDSRATKDFVVFSNIAGPDRFLLCRYLNIS